MRVTDVARADTYASHIESRMNALLPHRQTMTPRSVASWNFSPIRILSFLSLFLGVRGELKLSGLRMYGEQTLDHSGTSVSCAGDVNGDGGMDFLIGSVADPTPDRQDAGKTYCVFGGPHLKSIDSLELSLLNGTNGLVLLGDRAGDRSGLSVSGVGDVNGDGMPDMAIAGADADPSPGRESAGRVYLVWGKLGLGSADRIELASLNGTSGCVINGNRKNDLSGSSLSGIGDVNDDGFPDLAIGAPGAMEQAGITYVIWGRADLCLDGAIELSALNETTGLILHGEKGGDQSGRAVSGAGDVNQDGTADFVIGAPYAAETGKAYVVFGGRNLGSEGMIELSRLNGTVGYVLYGNRSGDLAGWSVAGAGDVNGDGKDDFLVGAPATDIDSSQKSFGTTYVVFGQTDLGKEGAIALSGLNGVHGFPIHGFRQGGVSGWSVAGAGDVNGDGTADIVIGARLAGETYLVFGRPMLGSGGSFNLSSLDGANGVALRKNQGDDYNGYAVAGGCDLDGDRRSDFLVGAPKSRGASDEKWAGRVYMVGGKQLLQAVPTGSPLVMGSTTLFAPSASSSGNEMMLALVGAIIGLILSVCGCTGLFLRERWKTRRRSDTTLHEPPPTPPEHDEYTSARIEATDLGHYQSSLPVQKKSTEDDYDRWCVIQAENAHWERHEQYD